MEQKNEQSFPKTFILDDEKLQAFITEAVNNAFEFYLASNTKGGSESQLDSDDTLDTKGAAAFTHYSQSSIYDKTRSNKIPFHRAEGGRLLFFSKKELIAWIKQNHSPTDNEIKEQVHKKTKIRPKK